MRVARLGVQCHHGCMTGAWQNTVRCLHLAGPSPVTTTSHCVSCLQASRGSFKMETQVRTGACHWRQLGHGKSGRDWELSNQQGLGAHQPSLMYP